MKSNTRWHRGILVLIAFLCLIPTVSSAQSSATPAPYIYYLSNVAHGIVIERADGSDSRIIAPDSLPDDHTVIQNLAWSPSGGWLAWMSGVDNGPGRRTYNGWIARADGTKKLDLLDEPNSNILALYWSPTADLLYAAQTKDHQLTLLIVDVELEKVIAQANYTSSDWFPGWYDGLPSGWLADGTGIYFVLQSSESQLLGHLNINGQLTTNVSENIVDATNSRLFHYVVHREDPDVDLLMEDLTTGKRILFNTTRRPQTTYQTSWDSSMEYALIYARNCQNEPCVTRLDLLNWEAGTVQNIAHDVHPLENLPLAVHNSPSWSPNGEYAILSDGNLLETSTGEITPLNMPGDWQWVRDDPTLILKRAGETNLYRYNLTEHTQTKLDYTLPNTNTGFSPSPDGRVLGLRWYSTENDAVDLQTRQEWQWPHHSLGASAGPIIDYLWNDDSRWFMTGEMSAFASGGVGASAVMILNTDATVRRELSLCWSLGNCAGFVPERVIPHLKPGSTQSVIQEPERTLLHHEQVYGVSWSPDGQKIASYSDYQTGFLNIWDVSSTPRLIATYPTTQRLNLYPGSTNLYWSPDGKTVTISNSEVQEIWDIETGQLVSSGETSPFASPDGRFTILQNDTGDKLSIMNTSTAESLAQFSFDDRIYWASWSRDSQTAFIQMPDDKLGVWSGAKLRALEAKDLQVYSADYQVGGRWIVGGSLFQRIHVWDAETGQRVRDLNWYATGVALSPDGSRLAAAGTRLVTIWETAKFGD